MNFKSLTFTFAAMLLTFLATAQSNISGIITDENGEGLFGVTVRAGDEGTTTDFDGSFALSLSSDINELVCSYVGYETYIYTITSQNRNEGVISIQMKETATLLNTATVTSGKFEKPLGEVTVSLEVLQPDLIESNNATSVDDILDKVPGVTIVDGQANIRGGSGYSYGAGSRVLLLVDDIPILQADAGFPNWDDLPVENIDQIEVVKGAASALYGSSALNGIINVRTGYAKSEPELKVSVFGRSFNAPKDEAKHWWAENDTVPRELGASISYKRKIDKLDLVTSAYYLDQIEHNKDTYANYGRFTLNTRYRATDNLSFGFNGNFNKGNNQSFFFWQDAEAGALLPSPGTITNSERTRFNIDPFVTYIGANGIKHKLQGRYYNVNNNNNNDQSNASQLGYAEYQFQKRFDAIPLTLTTGLVYTGTQVDAPLYGDTTYTSRNAAAYLQADYKVFDKLNISGGARYEYNQLNNPGFTYFDALGGAHIIEPSNDTEGRPVFRLGANFQASEGTFFRASWGQGYRYPTIAEQYIVTIFGGIPITPNPDLTSETGFSTEIGIKQGFIAGGFNGFVDVAGFISEYQNMMEFNLGKNLFTDGFQSQNVGDTSIKGVELSVAGQGNIGGAKLSILAGYTFLDPKFKDFDNTLPEPGTEPTEGQLNALNSSADINILKYRSRHSAKLDGQLDFDNGLLFGASINFNSQVEAIDRVFETLIVPGLLDYRAANQQGNTIVSARLGYTIKEHFRITLVGNNLLNAEYSNRPGLIEAPRNMSLRLDYTL